MRMNPSRFQKELEALKIDLTSTQETQLNRYYELLIEWNERMNLTGITEKEQVYLKHFYDSATLQKVIDLSHVITLCDVGTGAGFPGLVLKILFPKLKVTLVDSLQKRIHFLDQVIQELELTDIQTVHARAEEFAKEHIEQFDVVTARAVATLPILLEYCMPMVKKDGYFIPMKANAKEELEQSTHALQVLHGSVEKVQEFSLPIEESHRTLVKVKKEESCPKRYPRKYSEMKKRPL